MHVGLRDKLETRIFLQILQKFSNMKKHKYKTYAYDFEAIWPYKYVQNNENSFKTKEKSKIIPKSGNDLSQLN